MNTDSTEFPRVIADAAVKFFHSLPKQGKPSLEKREWTTMAALVKVQTDEMIEVVALGTGTRCLGQNEVSPLGDCLNDSHAEVIMRRSFLLYLYDQLTQMLVNKPSIFIRKNLSSPMVEIRPGVSFNMFISHVPCGDAAIFELDLCSNNEDSDNCDVKVKKIKLDPLLHRTGAKLKVGKEYEENQDISRCRVKPGKGDPTLSMSCSDKIAKWQILGLQGNLLGNFFSEPIRLNSIVIGGKVEWNKESLQRAVHDRFLEIPEVVELKVPVPRFYQSEVNFMEFKNMDVPTPGAISCYLKESVSKHVTEVCVSGRKQGVTKKNMGNPSSRLGACRKNLLQKFLQTHNQFKDHDLTLHFNVGSNVSYACAKVFNSCYNERWKKLKASNILRGWTTKPEKMIEFTAND